MDTAGIKTHNFQKSITEQCYIKINDDQSNYKSLQLIVLLIKYYFPQFVLHVCSILTYIVKQTK